MIKYLIGTLYILWCKILYGKNKKNVPRIAPKAPLYRQIIWFYKNPTQIINNLYLGSSFNAYDLELLKKNNIKVILNITHEIDNFYQSNSMLSYYKFPIFDNNIDDINNILGATFRIINKHLNKNESILVHCYMGASRSASVIIHYLMKKYNLPYVQVLNFVIDKRPIVNLSEKFNSNLRKINILHLCTFKTPN